jgi:hypothetical protein
MSTLILRPVMVVMMAVLVTVAMFVVFAAVRCDGQSTAQIGRHQFFHGRTGLPGTHRDSMLVEDGQRPPADAPGNDRLDPQLTQPSRERAWLMLRCRKHRGAEGGLFLGVDLDHGKLAAAPEVVVQTSVLNWNCNFHRCVRARRG